MGIRAVQRPKARTAPNQASQAKARDSSSIRPGVMQSQKQIPKTTVKENLNGAHQKIKKHQNKIGENTQESLKKVILIFGKNMKKNFGRNTMHVLDQMEKMENLIRPKNQKTSQMSL